MKLLRIKLTVLLLSVIAGNQLYGQTHLSGKITDEYGFPLIGVTVMVKKTKEASVTDLEGKYSLTTKKDLTPNDVIVFSYIGYKAEEKKFTSGEIDLVMQEDIQALDDIVVTALGIKREEKGLGYSTQRVDGDDITAAMSVNWSSALTGKVAGLNIMSPGGPVSSTAINLRGETSFTGAKNNALIIVDNVPLSTGIVNSGDAYGAGDNAELPVDYGNGFSDINPDDIESVQILKGATAAALYGSRAGGGAILITTKSGNRKEKGIGVSINSNFSIENVLRWPDYQYEFGQGLPTNVGAEGTEYAGKLYYSYGANPDGKNSSTSGTSSAYGARFNPNQLYYQFDPVTQGQAEVATPWVAYKNNRKDLFQTGYTLTNSVAFEGRNEKGSSRFSLTHTKNEWILDNTGFYRIIASFSTNQRLSQRVMLDVKSNYTYNEIENTPGLGYNSNSISYFLIFQNPNVNLDWLRPIWRNGEENIRQLQPYSSFINNPFLILYESINPAKKHSALNHAALTFDLERRLKFKVSSGARMSYNEREQQRPVSDVVFGNGYYKKQNIFDYEVNTELLLSYADSFGEGFHMTAHGGANFMYNHYNSMSAAAVGLITPGVYKLDNSASALDVNSLERNKAINSIFAAANFSYQNKVFVDITGRNDWTSTLPPGNRSFFYPSVTTSIITNEIIELPTVISLLKIRASWAKSGNDTDPYQTAKYYESTNFPGSAVAPTILYNDKLNPESSSNVEGGFDFRMFNNRLGLDFTFYNNKTDNQIIKIPMDPATGYSYKWINAGLVRNRGAELVVNFNPVTTKDFSWNGTINWSKNKNKILELTENMEEQMVMSTVGTVSFIGTVGGSLGDMWGYKLVRNEDGDVIIGENGLPVQASEIEYVGNAYPSWKAGFQNEFRIKNFKIHISIDGQKGGKVYSQAHHKMTEQGKLAHTLNGRLPGTSLYMSADDPRIAEAGLTPLDGVYMIAPGVVDNGDGTYSPNTQVVTIEAYNKEYWRRANVETNSFDASYLKLREVRVEYNIPSKTLAGTPFSRATVAFYGRNLAMWTKFPLFDPESAALNGNSITPGVEMGQLPSTRSFGVNVGLKF